MQGQSIDQVTINRFEQTLAMSAACFRLESYSNELSVRTVGIHWSAQERFWPLATASRLCRCVQADRWALSPLTASSTDRCAERARHGCWRHSWAR